MSEYLLYARQYSQCWEYSIESWEYSIERIKVLSLMVLYSSRGGENIIRKHISWWQVL